MSHAQWRVEEGERLGLSDVVSIQKHDDLELDSAMIFSSRIRAEVPNIHGPSLN